MGSKILEVLLRTATSTWREQWKIRAETPAYVTVDDTMGRRRKFIVRNGQLTTNDTTVVSARIVNAV